MGKQLLLFVFLFLMLYFLTWQRSLRQYFLLIFIVSLLTTLKTGNTIEQHCHPTTIVKKLFYTTLNFSVTEYWNLKCLDATKQFNSVVLDDLDFFFLANNAVGSIDTEVFTPGRKR